MERSRDKDLGINLGSSRRERGAITHCVNPCSKTIKVNVNDRVVSPILGDNVLGITVHIRETCETPSVIFVTFRKYLDLIGSSGTPRIGISRFSLTQSYM